jgi:hypothetical protein
LPRSLLRGFSSVGDVWELKARCGQAPSIN